MKTKSSVLFLCAFVLFFMIIVANPAYSDIAWYYPDWEHRKKITIDSTMVSGSQDLDDFPVLVSITGDPNLNSTLVQENGQDLFFTGSDGNSLLDYEIEKFIKVNGDLVAWVKLPVLSYDSDTEIYLYYGNQNASSGANSENVWDSNYKAVWHFNQPSGGSDSIKDSTSNSNHGTDGGSPTLGTFGKIGEAIEFDGKNDFVSASTPYVSNQIDLTFSLWINVYDYTNGSITDSTGSYFVGQAEEGQNLFSLKAVNDQFGFQKRFDNGRSFGGPTGGAITTAKWTHITMTRDYNNYFGLYVDGTEVDTVRDDAYTLTLPAPLFGNDIASCPGGECLVGKIDEARISNIERSADWIKTEFNNQNSTDSFYGVGLQENKPIYGDVLAPSFSTGFTEDEYPLTINDIPFSLSQLERKSLTTIIRPGDPIQLKVLLFEDGGPFNIQHVDMHTNLRGDLTKAYQSDAGIIYEKNENATIVDPTGFFSNADVTVSEKGNKLEVVFDITFAKGMEKSNIIIRAWDSSENHVILEYEDAWEVVEQSEEITTLPQTESDVISLKTDKTFYVREEKIAFFGTVTEDNFSKLVTITIHDPAGNFVTLNSTLASRDGNFEAKFSTDKLGSNGTYSATAFTDDTNRGISVPFDFSLEVEVEPVSESKIEEKLPAEINVPTWIKSTAEWWSEDQISDDEFVKGIEYLIKEKIIKIPETQQSGSDSTREIPAWIKSNAGWWAGGQVSDNEFVQAIQWLVANGIMKI